MTQFFTADLHFGHVNIIKYCNRPYVDKWAVNVDESMVTGFKPAVECMNEDIVERWNKAVKPDDDVMIVGDLCMGKISESLKYVKQLNGHKILMPGNHERMFGPINFKATVHWEDIYREAGIERFLYGICNQWLDDKRIQVQMSHFPFPEPDYEYESERNFSEYRPVDRGQWLLHGHTHGLWRQNGRMVDVGVDAWGGVPVAEEEIVCLIRQGVNDLPKLEWL